jgi:DNA-binding MarR family transcriptional regulator
MIARSREMELARFGITPEQSHVLYILSTSGGSTTINDIVEITQRQHHSISTLINRMTKQGLVSKRKDPHDNRKYEVVITRKGQELYRRITQDSIKNNFSCLSDEAKGQLRKHLKCLLIRAYEVLGKDIKSRMEEE